MIFFPLKLFVFVAIFEPGLICRCAQVGAGPFPCFGLAISGSYYLATLPPCPSLSLTVLSSLRKKSSVVTCHLSFVDVLPSAMSASSSLQPSRHRFRWSLDFSSRPPSARGTDLPSPVGFSPSSIHADASSRQTENALRAKRSWDVALGPIKQVPMNLFIMYMSGNTISIFPIMMVIMMAVRPFKTLFTVGATFKALDASNTGSDGQVGHYMLTQ